MQKMEAYDGTLDLLKGDTLNPGVEQPCRIKKPAFEDDIKTVLEFAQGLLTIYAFGFFWYRDKIGNSYKTAFCRRYDRNTRRFVIVDDANYEYAD